MKKIVLVILLMLFSVAFLMGDVYIKTKNHTPAMEMMGQKTPEKNDISEQWFGKDKMAIVMPAQTIVIDISIKKIFFIYHGQKSYLESTLPLDMSQLLPKEVAGMMGMMKMTVTVTPTDKTKTIINRKCNGYTVDIKTPMMTMKSISWVTTDLPFDWKDYSEKMYAPAITALMPMIDAASITELKKIKGFQIAQETSISVMEKEIKTTAEVVEITEIPAPAGLYSVPADYKKQDKLNTAIGMKR